MIKSFTDIEQSKKLAKILPIESADMYWFRQIDSDYFPPNVESICPTPLFKDGNENFNYDIPCWSLASLLSVLPRIDIEKEICSDNTYDYRVKAYIGDEYIGDWYNNPIDACVAMIERLHELNLL